MCLSINFVYVYMCVSVHVHVYVHYLCKLGIELWSSESIENPLSDYIISSVQITIWGKTNSLYFVRSHITWKGGTRISVSSNSA